MAEVPEHKVERLDVLVASRGLASSREQARRLIGAGKVLVNSQLALKPAKRYPVNAAIALKAGPRFVSRGGEKLDAAIRAFGLAVQDEVCLDIGASTGGFSDCLLQHGARRVYAVDVGKGQLHWKLRNDPRVVIMEGVNARYLEPKDMPEPVGIVTIDVSFISLTKVLPPATRLVRACGRIITLVKPQFEAGRSAVSRGGVIRSDTVRRAVVEEICRFGSKELRLGCEGWIESPLRGPAGNVEYLVCWNKQEDRATQ
ncbi:MAG: TlyA family RNA methyltransferase [Kiritimatiellia bacterium]